MSGNAAEILPVPGEKNVLITSALPYVNNVPHLGNIIGCVLSADVYSRFCKLRGYNSIYVCGTDEYGTATETKALQEGVTPQEICNKYHALHKQVYDWFDIDFDIFGRTSTEQQTKICQDIFHRNEARGLVHEEVVEQLYCEKCEKFLADRFVSGTCPDCGFDDAKGDQCDGCGHLMNAVLLGSPKCSTDGSMPIVRSSKHLFLDLPQLSGQLTDWIDESSIRGEWSANSTTTTRSWLTKGLKSRCITRDLKWGTPVPRDGFRDKVFYVWFDAPIGYISITANLTEHWEKWWKNPKDVELVQFMGKDNIPFHTVIFPSTLMGADDNYTLLHHISTTEYLNYESGKFSKSRGVGVFGDSVQKVGVPSEVWRYYLLWNRPELSDTVFTWDDFAQKNNSELLKNLGNFINRALKFCKSKFDGIVPQVDVVLDDDQAFVEGMSAKLAEFVVELDAVKIKAALKVLMSASSMCNAYFQQHQPWTLAKSPDTMARCASVVGVGCNAVVALATMAEPFMPALTTKILQQMNLDRSYIGLRSTTFRFSLPAGHEIGEPEPLFQQISPEQVAEWREKFGGVQQQEQRQFPLDVVCGRVESVVQHEDAEHLYVLQVDVGGNGTRQIVSGLRNHYSLEELVGKKVAVVANLKAGNFRGVRSHGMLLCAVQEDLTRLLLVSSAPGTPIVPDGYDVVKKRIDAKKGFAKAQRELLSNELGEACYQEQRLLSDGHPVVIDRLTGVCQIK